MPLSLTEAEVRRLLNWRHNFAAADEELHSKLEQSLRKSQQAAGEFTVTMEFSYWSPGGTHFPSLTKRRLIKFFRDANDPFRGDWDMKISEQFLSLNRIEVDIKRAKKRKKR